MGVMERNGPAEGGGECRPGTPWGIAWLGCSPEAGEVWSAAVSARLLLLARTEFAFLNSAPTRVARRAATAVGTPPERSDGV